MNKNRVKVKGMMFMIDKFLFIVFTIFIIFIIKKLVVCENFTSKELTPKQKILIKNPYDNFYAPVYNSLITEQIIERSKFEVEDLIKNTSLKKFQHASLLDIGTGGGDHLIWLKKKNFKNLTLSGIDKSDSMLNITKKKLKNQSVRLIHRDVLDDDLFLPSTFSHITCYYFTIYLLNLNKLLKNVFTWLRPGGWVVVQLADLYKFDPILDASSPFIGTTLQRYAKNRITESKVHFKKFVYFSNFSISSKKSTKKCYFNETFKFNNKPTIRKQTHTLNVFSIDNFIEKMSKYKFNLKHTTHMSSLNYAFQYILYFQKE